MPSPLWTARGVTLHGGDCLDVLRTFPDESVAAVVTDPPYGLREHKRTEVEAAVLSWLTGDRTAVPGGRGFMGHEWDAFVPPPAVWDEVFRVLKPGGHLLAFSGSRTYDLMGMSIRLAGLTTDTSPQVRDGIAWLYGSGFPKSLDVSKAIDRMGGNADKAGEIRDAIRAARTAHGWTIKRADAEFCGGTSLYSWYEGRPAGFQTPTPAVFARIVKAWPELADLAASVAAIDREQVGVRPAGRIAVAPGEGRDRPTVSLPVDAGPATDAARTWEGWGTALKPAFEPIVVARKPLTGTVAANVLTHGTGALNVDACRIGSEARPVTGRWPANVVLDESQADALDEQSGTLTSGANPTRRGSDGDRTAYGEFAGQDDANPQRGTDIGGASRFFYTAKASADERIRLDGVGHSTVKPLSLIRWLVRLVTPPGGTVLDPFAGSGTTGEACLLEGFPAVLIERDERWHPHIRQRVDRRVDPAAAVARARPDDLGLFELIEVEQLPPPVDTRAGEASADRRYTDAGGTSFAMKPGFEAAERYEDAATALR